MYDFKVALIDPVGGHADNYYNYGLSIGLANNNVEVFYSTSNSTQEIKHDGVHTLYYFTDIWTQKNKALKLKRYIQGFRKTIKFARKNDIKVVHLMVFHFDWLFVFSVLYSKMRGFKVITTLHDVTSFTGSRIPLAVEKKVLNSMDQVVVHNNYSYSVINGIHAAGHYHVIHHGNYMQFIKKVEPQNIRQTLQLLFFGQIRKVKGLDVLVNALPILKKKGVDVKLTIAGRVWKDDNIATYEEIIARDGTGDMVEMNIGYIPNDKVWDYFNNTNIVVLPYREIYQSGVLLMAMSYGRAVLTSNIRAFADVINDKENGLLFESDNSESLAEKIEYIYNNKETLRQLEERSTEFVKTEYDWDVSAKKIKQVYQQALLG